MRKLNKNNGITLISLVITIIIMLILVGVSITLAVNGGLFEYAGNAVGDTKNAMKNEQGLIDEIIDKYIVPNVPIEEKFSEIYNENTTITQGEYTATIPGGFAVGISDGINKIKSGLVITDEVDENGNSIGNEFVWVPCTTDETNTSVTQYKKYETSVTNSSNYEDYKDWDDDGGNGDSVAKYVGFYVARYEAGIPDEANWSGTINGATYIYYESDGETSARNTDSYKPVSKKNNPCWNGISQINAKTVSKKMYENSTAVESSLIDNYAWDTIVNWMESKEEYKEIITESTKYGNYRNSNLSISNVLYAIHVLDYKTWKWPSVASEYKKGTLSIIPREAEGTVTEYEIATGSLESAKILNIYDMAGNMWEWTTETGNHETESGKKDSRLYAVRRGGGFFSSGETNSIYYISGTNGADDVYPGFGFRVVLYIR